MQKKNEMDRVVLELKEPPKSVIEEVELKKEEEVVPE